MLAFLPALCLATYWAGGEVLLMICALFTPLLYAATGGFGSLSNPQVADGISVPSLESVAADFLEIAHLNGQTTACYQIEMSGLGDIAHSLGDEAANEARKLVKIRIGTALRTTDHVFQAGDSRFVVLIAPGFRLKLETLIDLATRMREAAEDPLSVAGSTRCLTMSIGIASSLNFGRNVTAETWLASAAQALSEALLTGPSTARVWSDKLSRIQNSRRALREDLATAFEKGQIQAHFQPQVSIRTGRLIGMEALARWEHPSTGTVGPSEFLRALEDSGQMDQLGRVMLAQSLDNLLRWDGAQLDVPTVSVNLSASELRNPNLPGQVRSELDRTGLTAQRLAFEVLESVIADGADDLLRRNLCALSEMGCRIDLDDFGTGHASITSLQMFPIHRVKIDQSFVRGSDRSADAKRMLSAILSMTERLGLETLAEGVESVEEQGLLRDLGCAYAQGFLFGRPMSPGQSDIWLEELQARLDSGQTHQIRRVK